MVKKKMHFLSNCFSGNIFFCILGESKQYDDGCTPLDYLQRASHCIASAIKLKPKDPNLHLQLGKILEEKYYCEDLFGQKKEVHA